MVINYPIDFIPLELVFGMYEMLSQGASRLHCGGDAHLPQMAHERLSDASVVWQSDKALMAVVVGAATAVDAVVSSVVLVVAMLVLALVLLLVVGNGVLGLSG